MQTVNIGFIGLGNVGCGAVALLQQNRELIERRAGCRLEVRKIATRRPDKPRPISVDPSLITGNVREVLEDPNVQIVVEVMGGIEPARQYVLEAIERGKSVVTCNKELMAKHGSEVLDLARAKGVDVNFEGSVGGGIPIVQPLKQQLVGNRIRRIMGIVNGTTNYILTKMTREKKEFADVLREAQALGYAEADPTADVDGYDAMYKLCILAAIAFGSRVKVEDVYREGIGGVHARDIDYAQELGYTIKLLAIAQEDDERLIEMRVHPVMLPNAHPLAAVSDVFNAILVEADGVGRVMFYGRGAGASPTGSAVVGDIVEIARNICYNATGRVSCTCDHTSRTKPMNDMEASFFLRMQVTDKPGVIARIAGILGDEGVSIASIVQKATDGKIAEIVWITHTVRQAQMTRSLDDIRRLDCVEEVSSVIRVEGE
jgi:homoserine dehydrogenase